MYYWSTSQTSCIDCKILIRVWLSPSSNSLRPSLSRCNQRANSESGLENMTCGCFLKRILMRTWQRMPLLHGFVCCAAIMCNGWASWIHVSAWVAATQHGSTSSCHTPVVHSTSPQLCYSSLPAERSQCCAVTAGHFYLCMCVFVCQCAYLSSLPKMTRPAEIFDMTAVIQHPQLLNNNGTSNTNHTGTKLSFYADPGFLIMTANPDLCKPIQCTAAASAKIYTSF